jgi:lipid-A-disaccharide synthase
MDEEVVKELIQENLTTAQLKSELHNLLQLEKRNQLAETYARLKQNLGGEGASQKTATLIVNSQKMK